MDSLFAQVLPLAFGAAVSPMVLAASVLILAGRDHPRTRALAFLAGASVPLFAAGAFGAIVLGRPSSPSSPRFHVALSPSVDIVFGALLLLLALRAAVHKPPTANERASAKTEDAATSGGVHATRFFVFGFWSMATNPTTLAMLIPASKDIGRSSADLAERALVFAVLLAVTLSPIIVPIALEMVAPTYAHRVLGRLGQAARSHRRVIAAVVMAVLGVYLLARGIRAL